MSQHYHAVVWVDHHVAKIFHFGREESDKIVIHPQKPARQVHHKANSIGSGHAKADEEFLHSIAEALAGSGAILITGPATAKHELAKHLARHDPEVMKAVRAVESIDHPSDGQLVAYARKYFKADDLMHKL